MLAHFLLFLLVNRLFIQPHPPSSSVDVHVGCGLALALPHGWTAVETTAVEAPSLCTLSLTPPPSQVFAERVAPPSDDAPVSIDIVAATFEEAADDLGFVCRSGIWLFDGSSGEHLTTPLSGLSRRALLTEVMYRTHTLSGEATVDFYDLALVELTPGTCAVVSAEHTFNGVLDLSGIQLTRATARPNPGVQRTRFARR